MTPRGAAERQDVRLRSFPLIGEGADRGRGGRAGIGLLAERSGILYT